MQDFFNWQGVFGTVAGVIGAIVSIFVWIKSKKIENFLEKEKARLNEKIKIILKQGDNEYILPDLRRQEVTRGEIQGRLRIALGNKPFYTIAYLNDEKYFNQIDEIVEGSDEAGNSSLIIDCTEKEFAQFNFDLPKPEKKKRVRKVKENDGK